MLHDFYWLPCKLAWPVFKIDELLSYTIVEAMLNAKDHIVQINIVIFI